MVQVYAVVLTVSLVALIGWILLHALAANLRRPAIDPEDRLGIPGRRVVAGGVAFGLAGMSAEFSPRDLGWPVALLLALLGAAAAAWYAGRAAPRPGTGD